MGTSCLLQYHGVRRTRSGNEPSRARLAAARSCNEPSSARLAHVTSSKKRLGSARRANASRHKIKYAL
jgi:hypothetical protein